ncbi:twin-arginine translocation pathway signal protein [Roseomonas sp. KE2513]|uniref:Bug family tripartite tricarboxylate transporter substrate binding protein n=1 Tax=Roseomonas sp. KE2513 TaxID=2479202 RepID=UPI0018DEF7BE|nr:tripartite tricarboxylate transporter substrate-binding protein [Roseomonas sp. KE2513]MBI0538794.1 twin-arginine translocation pathway signal protein [Roseomonas sp. KE2513]
MIKSMISRRSTVVALGAAPLIGALGRSAAAQPRAALDRNARMVVGYVPGGPTDTIARLLAERLRGTYAPQVIVDNRPGAAGRLGVELIKGAAPDGTNVLLTPATTLTIFPHVYPRTTRYDALTDFVPVSTICASPYAFAVRADHPAHDLASFAAWAKQQGDAVPFGSPAAGAGPHFAGVRLAQKIGVQLTHVPYRGTAPALQDMLGGQIPAVSLQVGDLVEYHRAGKARILGVSSAARLPSLPDVPTFSELGHPDLTGEEWFGILLPARTPAPMVEGLHTAILKAAENPELREALERQQYRMFTQSPQEFAELIRTERAKWGPVVQESGFKSDE